MTEQTTKFTDMSDNQLIGEALALYDSIYVTECYGVKDMLYLESITRELEKRGYTAVEDKKLTFKRRESANESSTGNR
jgi:hypothetical protein